MRATSLKLAIKARTKRLGLLAPGLRVYGVQDVVLVQTLEEGIPRLVALFPVRSRGRFEGAAGGLCHAAGGGGGAPREPGHGGRFAVGSWGLGGRKRGW